MVKINLLAEGKRPIISRRAKQPGLQLSGANAANMMMAALTVVGLLASAIWYFVLESRIKEKDAAIQVAQKEVDELKQVIAEVENFKKRRDELNRKIKVITDLKANQRGPVQIMDEVSRALPELIWLANMDVAPKAINLRGTALNMSAVANFIENLDRVEPFFEPVLQDATRGRRAGAYNYRLTVGYSFAKPAAPAAPAATPAAAPGQQIPTPGAAGAVASASATKAANERGAE